jgi:choline kinase
MKMIILAAGEGRRLRPLTDNKPKCLVELCGEPLLEWQLSAARGAGLDDFVIVGGYLAEQLRRPGVRVIENLHYGTSNMVVSLFCAEAHFDSMFTLSYGDIVFDTETLELLLESGAPISVVVDKNWYSYWKLRFDDPLSDAESLRLDRQGNIQDIGQPEKEIKRIEGQYIGLMSFRESGVDILKKAYKVALEADRRGLDPFGCGRPLSNMYMTDFLQGIIALGYPVRAIPVSGGWLEIDSLRDLTVAEELIKEGRLSNTVA